MALTYTSAIIWNASIADDALWEKLHHHFTEPELVELGSFVALTFGQQRWIKTLGIGHGEVLGDTSAGTAAGDGGGSHGVGVFGGTVSGTEPRPTTGGEPPTRVLLRGRFPTRGSGLPGSRGLRCGRGSRRPSHRDGCRSR